jgi:hypothetical protein
MKLLMWFFAVVAVGCLVAGGVSFWLDQQPPVKHPNFTVMPEEIDWLDCPAGEHDLVLKITNPAKVPRRIIGLAEG